MPRPKKIKSTLLDAYEKEISELLKKPEPEEDGSSLDDELDFDCEHYNRIETYED